MVRMSKPKSRIEYIITNSRLIRPVDISLASIKELAWACDDLGMVNSGSRREITNRLREWERETGMEYWCTPINIPRVQIRIDFEVNKDAFQKKPKSMFLDNYVALAFDMLRNEKGTTVNAFIEDLIITYVEAGKSVFPDDILDVLRIEKVVENKQMLELLSERNTSVMVNYTDKYKSKLSNRSIVRIKRKWKELFSDK